MRPNVPREADEAEWISVAIRLSQPVDETIRHGGRQHQVELRARRQRRCHSFSPGFIRAYKSNRPSQTFARDAIRRDLRRSYDVVSVDVVCRIAESPLIDVTAMRRWRVSVLRGGKAADHFR